jgi:hypothetical protein
MQTSTGGSTSIVAPAKNSAIVVSIEASTGAFKPEELSILTKGSMHSASISSARPASLPVTSSLSVLSVLSIELP